LDPSLYTLIHNEHLFALELYVDDCLIIWRRCKFLLSFKQDFSSQFKIDDLDLAT